MKNKILRILLILIAPVLSGALLILAFPPHDMGRLVWVALVPLLVGISGRSLKFAFFSAYVCGIVWFVGVFGWILDVPGYKPLHHVILAIYLGFYLGFFGLAHSFISRRWAIVYAHLAAPFVWVSLEYVRSNLSFLALPWPLLAHSQYQIPPIIQSASFAGAYGVSFLVVAVNSTLALIIIAYLSRLRFPKLAAVSSSSRRTAAIMLFTTMALVCLAWFHGQIVLRRPVVGKEIKLSLLQGNIDRSKKWNPKFARFIMQTYENMTTEALIDQPTLIVWPEAATPRSITRDRRLYNKIRNISSTARAHLLLGSTHLQKIKGKGRKGVKFRNSAFLISPEREEKVQRYDKIRLLPFGEYMPMKETVPWSYIGVPNIGSFVPGKEFTVFEGPHFRFGVTICWESIFPDFVREFVKRGAQLMINITNEGWFGETAPYQFLAANTFRAVENRVYVVRCANTGITCFIDPYGRIVDRVRDKTGQDILVRGILSGTVIPLDSKTIYTRYGDWFAWLSIFCSFGLLFWALLRKDRDLSGK